jgi:cellulose synthase (UDP-forming)
MTVSRARLPVLMRAGRASVTTGARLAGWADLLDRPRPECSRSRTLARVGGVAAVAALVLYLGWRLRFTLPAGGVDRAAALMLVLFEAVPLVGLLHRTVALWDLDTSGPDPVPEAGPGRRAVVVIPTTDEPVEVIAPTIAAACNLQPAHQTWVLDDGDRRWVEELCRLYGARYVGRRDRTGGRAGSINHALRLMQGDAAAGAEPVDVVAFLEAGQIPLPTFLTHTLGWFDDPDVALVRAPETSYNAGAFDDDGESAALRAPFSVVVPARDRAGAVPFWCGSGALVRSAALLEVGGVATTADGEDLHTTLRLRRAGWTSVHHHQVLAVGLAPGTPDQYLQQRRRRALGAMRVLVAEGLWAAKRSLSWREYGAYLNATLGWLAGIVTAVAFLVPAVLLLSGSPTSTASPAAFVTAWLAMTCLRVWGGRRLLRTQVRWRTTLALHLLCVPVGLSCLRWLLTRRDRGLQGPATAGSGGRTRGRTPLVLWLLLVLTGAVVAYGVLGLTGRVPWRLAASSVVAPGVWLLLAVVVLVLGIRRIRDAAGATSRRRAYRAPVRALVTLNGTRGELRDVSVSGAAVLLPTGVLAPDVGTVALKLPGAPELTLEVVRVQRSDDVDTVALQVLTEDWATYRALALWLFHTPPGVVDGLPPNAPAVAATDPRVRSRRPVLVRQHG